MLLINRNFPQKYYLAEHLDIQTFIYCKWMIQLFWSNENPIINMQRKVITALDV